MKNTKKTEDRPIPLSKIKETLKEYYPDVKTITIYQLVEYIALLESSSYLYSLGKDFTKKEEKEFHALLKKYGRTPIKRDESFCYGLRDYGTFIKNYKKNDKLLKKVIVNEAILKYRYKQEKSKRENTQLANKKLEEYQQKRKERRNLKIANNS